MNSKSDNNRTQKLFLAALEVPADQRDAWLSEQCGEDKQLLADVRSLLQHDALAKDPLEQGLSPSDLPNEQLDERDSNRAVNGSDVGPESDLQVEHAEMTAGTPSGDSPLPATTVPESSRPSSKQIGPYKLLQQIGEGGMGTVWMAEQERPVRRRVALKLVRGEFGSKETIARFEAERQALAMMDHQNIAKVLDAGTTDSGSPYFVMELVKGIPITQYCDDNKLSIPERLELLIPVCRAVQHAHQKGIIHRDLKPSNVLVTLYDGNPVPKVIDFGLAKALEQQTKLTDKTMFTEFGQVVGTVQYMSPEQAEMNALDVDTRTDIYSLGVMLYELLTGSTPLDKETIRQNALLKVLQMIRETEPPRPSARLSSSGDAITGISQQRKIAPAKLQQILRGELDWVVMKALEKDRTRRYETASSFAEDIQHYLDGEAVEARPPSTGYRLRKTIRKHRAALFTTATIACLLLAGLLGTGTMWFRASSLADANAELARENERKATEALEAEKAASEAAENERIARERMEAEKEKAEVNLLEANKQRQRAEANRAEADRRFVENQIQRAFRFYDEGDAYKAVLTLARTFEIVPQMPDKLKQLIGTFIGLWHDQIAATPQAIYDFKYGMRSGDVSPDGNVIAISFTDGSVYLVSSQGVDELPEKHGAEVNYTCFSPDGTKLATASDDGTARIWNVADKTAIGPPLQHDGEVHAAAFSPDCRLLMTGDSTRHTRLWDAKTGQELGEPVNHGFGWILDLAFSKDGSTVLCGDGGLTEDGKWLPQSHLWSVASAKPTGVEFKTSNTAADVVMFHPRDNVAVIGDRSGLVTLADLKTGAVLHQITAHRDRVSDLDYNDGANVFEITERRDWVSDLDYNNDATVLVTGSTNGTAKLWDGRTGKQIGSSLHHQNRVNSVAFVETDNTMFSVADNRAVVWKVRRPADIKPVRVIRIGAPLLSAAYTSEGSRIVTESLKDLRSVVKAWDSTTGEHLGDLTPTAISGPTDVSSDGAKMVYATRNRKCVLIDTSTGELLAEPIDIQQVATEIALHPDQDRFVATSDSNTAQLWSFATGAKIGQSMPHPMTCRLPDFSPDGKILATSCWDGNVRFWDAASGEPVGASFDCGAGMNSVAYSPNGKLIATVLRNKTVSIWNVDSRERISGPLSHRSDVWRAMFIPNSDLIATASGRWRDTRPEEAAVTIWSVSTGKMLAQWDHPHHISSIVLHPNGKSLLSACFDGNVRVWQLPTPIQGEPERIRVWSEVITGMTSQSSGAVSFLDSKAFAQRQARLEELGGPVIEEREYEPTPAEPWAAGVRRLSEWAAGGWPASPSLPDDIERLINVIPFGAPNRPTTQDPVDGQLNQLLRLGNDLKTRDRPLLAERILKRVVELAESLEQPDAAIRLSLSNAHHALGDLYNYALPGKQSLAVEAYQREEELLEGLLQDDRTAAVTIPDYRWFWMNSNFAFALAGTGKRVAAIERRNKALELSERIPSIVDGHDMADSYKALISWLKAENRDDEAEAVRERARKVGALKE